MQAGRRRRTMVIVGAATAVVVIAGAGALFQPWRLFIDTEVQDADPFVSAAAAPGTTGPTTAVVPTTAVTPSTAPTAAVEPVSPDPTTAVTVAPTTTTTTGAAPAIRVGTLRSIAHTTSGNVRVGPTPDGRQVVYLEDLATDNGPDVRVFLSPHPADGDASALGTDELDLGPMKGNIGNQTYEVPAGTDLSRYQSVVLWCEQFSVGFGVAGLAAA